MTHYPTATAPTLQQLGKATASALAVAAAILVVAVLPAEFGIDPLGAGKAMGLVRRPAETVTPIASATAAGLVKSEGVLRTDQLTLTLQPGEGTEVKANIHKGEHFVFSWSADAPVKADMHGEPPQAKENEFTTYWKVPQQSAAQGVFTAPFDGKHGWFWRNKGSKPVTITVKVSGFQQNLVRLN